MHLQLLSNVIGNQNTKNRFDHPMFEADKVVIKNNKIAKIGKKYLSIKPMENF